MADFNQKAARFFAGRYGFDKFNIFVFAIYIILFIVSIFTKGWLSIVFYVLMIAAVAYMLFRMLSRNTAKRYNENERFLKIWNPIAQFFKMPFLRFRDRKTHKYVKCPSCKKYMRIKKGKGERYINCPLCSHNFKVNS